MACVGTDGPLMRAKGGCQDNHIHLGAAYDEMNLGIRETAVPSDVIGSSLTAGVLSVAGHLIKIGFGHALQDFRVRSFGIVAVKSYHGSVFLFSL